MELTIDQALQKGVLAHKEGKLQDAERLYRGILKSQPHHPDANHNLGVLAAAVGKPAEAVPLFKLALKANPKVGQFWLSYLDALIKLERFDEAKRVLVESEKSGLSSDRLDTIKLQLMGGLSGVEPSQDQLNYLLEHYQAGKLGETEALASSLTQQFPKHPFAWKLLGAVLKQAGRANESLLPMQKSVELSPKDADAHSNLGVTLKALGRLDEAEASYKKAIALKPDFAKAHSNLGVTLQELGRLDEAEASLRHAIALKPNNAEAHSNLGVTLQELGRLDEAEASYKKAIALKPDFAEAHRYLTTLKKFSSEDEQFLKMQALYRDPAISEESRGHICFALAKASEDFEDTAKAFQFYVEGNALRKKQLGYDKAQDEKLFERLKANYQQIRDAVAPELVAAEPIPVFILGLPRSGTSLVEQIISSHPLVTGAGELPFVSQFGGSLAVGQSPADSRALATFREEYLSALKHRSEGNAIATDKMPQNFCFIGLVATALPEAGIIHVKRDPAAVCWANYTQYFANDSLGYCYSLDDILHYHELYQDLMKYWHQALPDRIYDLHYDALTENQEEETRKLIGHLGLEWSDACLSPQDNTRGVATASAAQVRQKVYQGSSEKWKRYQPFLKGALDHLSVGNQW